MKDQKRKSPIENLLNYCAGTGPLNQGRSMGPTLIGRVCDSVRDEADLIQAILQLLHESIAYYRRQHKIHTPVSYEWLQHQEDLKEDYKFIKDLRFWSLLWACYQCGINTKIIAVVLQISPRTIQSLLAKARKQIIPERIKRLEIEQKLPFNPHPASPTPRTALAGQLLLPHPENLSVHHLPPAPLQTPQERQIERLTTTLTELEQSTKDRIVLEALHHLRQTLSHPALTDYLLGRSLIIVLQRLNVPFKTAAQVLAFRSVVGKMRGLSTHYTSPNDLLADKTREFVGRDYVFAAIDQFVTSQPHGYFTIVGDPGMGKSTIMAEYLRRNGCIAHFNLRALGITSARQCLEHICAQLIVDFGLPYVSFPYDAFQDGTFLNQLLSEAGDRLPIGERLIIMVDALDEVDTSSQILGSNILYLPPTLPPRVYIILTRRNEDVPLTIFTPQEILDLAAYPAQNRQDVELHLRAQLPDQDIQSWIQEHALSQEDFVQILADLSENNFMYLRHVLPEIKAGTYRELHVQALPKGLLAYYEDHWFRMGMTTSPLPKEKIRIIYLMCEVRQPVSRQLLADFATDQIYQIDELNVQSVLDAWIQFLHIHTSALGTQYSLYHATFREFLHRKDIVQAAGVTIQGINKLITKKLWADLFGTD